MDSILVVDDDATARMLYQGVLEKEGFTVSMAATGKEMLLAIDEQKPDIILLDVILPDVSGLELCYKIRKDAKYAGMKILMVSGIQVRPAQVAKGIDTGADDYLTKPFDQKELVARVRNLLKLQQVEEQLRDKNMQLQKLSGYLRNTREEERKYLAEEVHEELGQLASALKMDIDWLAVSADGLQKKEGNRLSKASDTAELLISTIRKIASTLRPSTLDHLGLNASLQWLCKECTENNITCSFNETFDDTHLAPEVSIELFRICQESFHTIINNSAATRLTVSISEKNSRVYLLITCNAVFNLDSRNDSMGILMLRERAASIDGELIIESDQEKGSKIEVTVPIYAETNSSSPR